MIWLRLHLKSFRLRSFRLRIRRKIRLRILIRSLMKKN
jgi:hypothetical protein